MDPALQDAREREAATREILQAINQSRANEKPVFDVILANAIQLCGAPFACLLLRNDTNTHLEIVAHSGSRSRFVEVMAQHPQPLDSKSSHTVRALFEKKVIQVEDITQDEFMRHREPQRIAAVEDEGIRTLLIVPLISGDAAQGVMFLYRREVRLFEDRHIDLVKTFAEQAVIALENVKQFKEVEIQLEREAATRQILQVISQSRADAAPVFEVVVENAMRLCEAPLAFLLLCNENRTHLNIIAAKGARTDFINTLQQDPIPLDADVADSARAVLEQTVIQTDDLASGHLYEDRQRHRVYGVETEGIRTAMFVPLVSKGLGIGCIMAYRREVRPFETKHVDLLKSFAAQAVIAIENVQQNKELEIRLEREAATREILQVINRSRDDYGPVFDAILDRASRLCEAPLAYLHLCNPERTHLEIAAHIGATPRFVEFLKQNPLPLDQSLAVSARAVLKKKIVQTADLTQDRLYKDRNPHRVQAVEVEGIRSLLNVPLVAGDDAVGAIALYRREVRPFEDRHIELVKTFAEQAVIAIENVKQFKALKASTEKVQAQADELQRLNNDLEIRVSTQVDELERLGRLKRFLSPQVADAVVSSGDAKLLGSHRALIATLFCDMRGFTAFCETAEPEEAIEVLQTYHEAMGERIVEYGAGVDQRAGDGVMAIFNDPLPCDDPAGKAVQMALAMRDGMAGLCSDWRKLGHRLGFGVGISLGYATVGMVGSEDRYEYTASGTAVNLAARLCDHAKDGEILLSPRAYQAVEDRVEAESAGELSLKGIQAPLDVVRVISWKNTIVTTGNN